MVGKIFGIGLSRTGTSSLTQALRTLGLQVVHYPSDPETYEQLRTADFQLKLLEQVDAITDIPLVPYFRQMDRLYPGSKFILTVRDEASWLASIEQMLQARPLSQVRIPEIIQFYRLSTYGAVAFHREHFMDVFQDHKARVMHYFRNRPKDLLVMDICGGAGWEVLCPFLGHPVLSTPFPWENRGRILNDAR